MSDTQTVQSKPQSRFSILRLTKAVLSLILFISLIVLIFVSYVGMRDTMKIVKKSDQSLCKNSKGDFCLEMQSHYDGGWSIWEIKPWLPLSFGVTASGFENNQNLLMVCPMKYSEGDNEAFAKIKFIVQRQDNVNECQVAKR